MVYLQTISSCVAIVFGIATPILFFWLKTRLEKSIQNEYDKQLERFRAGCQQIINKSNVSFSWWHNERAAAIKSIYSTLAELEIVLRHATPLVTPCFSSKKEIDEYFKERFADLQTVYSTALHTWTDNKIFLESDINMEIDKMFDICFHAVSSYKRGLAGYGEKDCFRDFDKACESVIGFKELLDKIQKIFREQLQIEHAEE